MWIPKEVQSYLIHTNTLHIFDVNETRHEIYNNSINFDNISKIKIYMCRTINVYNFFGMVSGVYGQNVPWDKNYEYQIMMLLDDYYRKCNRRNSDKKRRRITIVANTNDPMMNTVLNKAIEAIRDAGFPNPFIERYSKQYIDFPENNTIFSVISDNFRPKTKIFIELTRDSELYVSMLPDKKRWRYITERNLPIVADVHFRGRELASGNGTITVEDYCKWYNLYRIHHDDNGNVIVSSRDNSDKVIFDMDTIWWYDHCPNPSSVVEQCKKTGVKLGYISYLTMLCRLEEDIVDELTSEHISPKEDLDEVLVWDGGSCEYFGMAKLFSIAKRFNITCAGISFTKNFSSTTEPYEIDNDVAIVHPECNKLYVDDVELMTNIKFGYNVAEKYISYDMVIMCPNCFHSEHVTISQTTKIQARTNKYIGFGINQIMAYRDDIEITCPECGTISNPAPLLDADIYSTIKILNEKGYYTDYCCSGHRDDTYADSTSYAYISFGPVSKMAEMSGLYKNISENLPESWYLDKKCGFGGVCDHIIRVVEDVQNNDPDKKYLEDILNWAKQLPNLT